MELKEFISETLTQIAQGVKDAQNNVVELGAKVNPTSVPNFQGDVPHCNGGGRIPTKVLCDVEFNVSLTNDTSTTTGSGISVLFGAIGIGGKHSTSDKDTTLNSIKFNVIMELPKQD